MIVGVKHVKKIIPFPCFCIYLRSHVLVGPLSPGAALIVKSCDTNFSANIICITVKNFIISLWLWDYLKVVPNLKSEPRGALQRPPRHSKKVNFKSNVTHLQEVIKNVYGKVLGL